LNKKILKTNKKKKSNNTKPKHDTHNKNQTNQNKNTQIQKYHFIDSKANTIEDNNENLPECLKKDKEKKIDITRELRIIDNMSTNDLIKKYCFSNNDIFDFFISNYSEENDSKINLNTDSSHNSNHIRNNSNNNRNRCYSVNFDIFNENLSEDEDEENFEDLRSIERIILKLKQRYKIIKIPFVIFEYHLIKTLKKGEIFGSLNEKCKGNPTIISRQTCFLLKIQREVFEERFTEMNKSDIFKVFTNFSCCPIFKDLSKILFYKCFFKKLKNKTIHKNEKVIFEGDSIKDLIFIREGSFLITVKKNIKEVNEIIKKLTNKITCENEAIENDKILGKFFIYYFNIFLKI